MIKISVRPSIKDVKKKVQRAKDDMEKSHPAMKMIAVFLDQWVQRNFRSQGKNAHSSGWKPLKAGGRWKGRGPTRRLDTSAKILQATGRLRMSFTPFSSEDNAGIGSELSYSKPHEEGLGHLPQRRMLPTQRQVRQEVERRLKDWQKKVVDKHD